MQMFSLNDVTDNLNMAKTCIGMYLCLAMSNEIMSCEERDFMLDDQRITKMRPKRT